MDVNSVDEMGGLWMIGALGDENTYGVLTHDGSLAGLVGSSDVCDIFRVGNQEHWTVRPMSTSKAATDGG